MLPETHREDFEKRIAEFPELHGKYMAKQSMVSVLKTANKQSRKKKKDKVCDVCGLPMDMCICEELKKEEMQKSNIW